MTVPLDVIRAFHNAYRSDIAAMDSAARAAVRGGVGAAFVETRHGFFNETLAWHADGEEDFVFTALERVAPLVAEAYARDHRGLDALSESLHEAVLASDPIAVVRETSAFRFFLIHHLNKEEAHLYRIFDERVPLVDQLAIVGKMAGKVPPGRIPDVVGWLFPLIGPRDRENMMRIWRQLLPDPEFGGVVALVRSAVGEEWAELTRRIPELQ